MPAGVSAPASERIGTTSRAKELVASEPVCTPHPDTPKPAALSCPMQRSPSVFAPRTYGDRPVSAFRFHAPISLDLVAASSQHGAPAELAQVLAAFSRHTLAYQATVARRCGQEPHNVCWFVQLPYHGAPGLPLSFSTQMGSPECLASSTVGMMLGHLEAMMLIEERSFLERGSLTGVQGL
jgi:hypothetical protein